MPRTPAELVLTSLLQVFGERNPDARRLAVADVFSADVEFRDAEGATHGREQLEAKISALLVSSPADWVFRPVGAAQPLDDVVRLAWSFGPPDGPPAVTGMDVAFVTEGLIDRMLTFLD